MVEAMRSVGLNFRGSGPVSLDGAVRREVFSREAFYLLQRRKIHDFHFFKTRERRLVSRLEHSFPLPVRTRETNVSIRPVPFHTLQYLSSMNFPRP